MFLRGMIRKSAKRFSEKIAPKNEPKARIALWGGSPASPIHQLVGGELKSNQRKGIARHGFALPRRGSRPVFAFDAALSELRGRRECRALFAPAALRAVKKARKQVTTGTPNIFGIP
jgi:hypothetical protein